MNAQPAQNTSTSDRTRRLVLLMAVVAALVLTVMMGVGSLGSPADAAPERSASGASDTSALMAGGSVAGSVGNN
jgi:hypothetical protein